MTVTFQKPTIDVRVNGTKLLDVVSVNTSSGFDQINLECSVRSVALLANVKETDTLEIWGSNGTYSGHIFSGTISNIGAGYSDTYGDIKGSDLLAKARFDWGGEEQEEINIESGAYVRHMLEISGIPSSAAHIESTGTWFLGVIDPLVLSAGDSVYSKIEDVDYYEGYKTFSLPTGVIVRLRVSAVSGANVAMTFEKGVQILQNATMEHGIADIKNRIIIEGATYEDILISSENIKEVSAANPFIPNPPGFITLKEQTDLIEDDDTAYAFAKRFLLDKNRRPTLIRFRVPFDPRVQPAMLAAVIHPDLLGGTDRGLILNVAHDYSLSGAFTNITLIGGSLSTPQNKKPVAVYDYQLYKEAEEGVAFYIGVCDGTLSYDPDGEIASYSWSISASGGSASSGSTTNPIFYFKLDGTVTEITITLTVTDNEALTGELVRVIPVSEVRTLVEDKYLAYGTASVSVDGEITWRDEVPPSGVATCLMPIAPVWGNIWGTTTGHIYATFNNLASPLVDLGAPHGAVAVTCVWVHETDNTRLWAGFDDGRVYFGDLDRDAQTAVWTFQGVLPTHDTVIELRESYGLLGELRATSGQGYYYSTDSGATWSLQHTFANAWRMASGYDANLASGLDDAAPLYREETTAPTVPSGVTHIRGLSFGWRDQELYAANDNGSLFLGTDPDTFNLALHADATSAIVNHMIRSGNERRVVYMAVGDGSGDNGFVKWIPDSLAPLYLRKTGTDAGLMIGYGNAHLPAVNVDLLMVGGNLGAGTGVYRYDHLAGIWNDVSGDLPSSSWSGIAASPLNSNHWIVWKPTAAYRTVNGGTNWVQLTGIGAAANTANSGVLELREVTFSPNNLNDWLAVGRDLSSFAIRSYAVVSYGTNNAATQDTTWLVKGFLEGLGPQGIPTSASWLNNDNIAVYLDPYPDSDTDGIKWIYYPASAVSGLGTNIGDTVKMRVIDADYNTGQIVGAAIFGDSDLYTSQGLSIEPSKLLSFDGDNKSTATIASDAIYIGTSDGVLKKAFLGDATTAVSSGDQVIFIRTDKQRKTGIAALVLEAGPTSKIAVSNGESWTLINPPSGMSFDDLGDLAQWIEPLAVA